MEQQQTFEETLTEPVVAAEDQDVGSKKKIEVDDDFRRKWAKPACKKCWTKGTITHIRPPQNQNNVVKVVNPKTGQPEMYCIRETRTCPCVIRNFRRHHSWEEYKNFELVPVWKK